ncbi:DUF4166 domain-containing protein [Rhodobacterales bacterium]|nr:DUF4166 domain-containing protein [Rhodobacterales bacterium]
MTEARARKRVVILGGYGVFGGKLAEALLGKTRFDVIVAGRSLASATSFCERHGGCPARLDRTLSSFAEDLALLSPHITVDAAGPFQAYGDSPYAVAEAALQAGSHYLDLSDDAAFASGLCVFDRAFKDRSLVALSGVSSVPALSSAAVETLRKDLGRIDTIETIILPGNRAPRGLSVIRAILSQAGQPVDEFRGGRHVTVPGWSGLERRTLWTDGNSRLSPRWSSTIGAPDTALFPKRYGALSVRFRAGLELGLLHIGLWCLSWPVRLGLSTTLEPLAGVIRHAAGWFENFGSDRGGMEVRIGGLDHTGRPFVRIWTLTAGAGDGPHIPAVPGAILCSLIDEDRISPGARPCVGEFDLREVEEATGHLEVETASRSDETPTVFQKALAQNFYELPAQVRELHTVLDLRHWSGKARVSRGKSTFGDLICRMVGFPEAGEDTPVAVTIEQKGEAEIWKRTFGGRKFRSVLSPSGAPGSGRVSERFGPLSFSIDLRVSDGKLHFPVSRGTLLGIPIPDWLLPISETTEQVQKDTFSFDVKVSMRGIGLLVRYQGWLRPDHIPGETREDAPASADLPGS